MDIRYSLETGSDPVTEEEVKSWLKVDFDTEDALITSLITQVRELAEEAAGLSLIDKTIEYFEEDEEILAYWIKLPYPDHNAITGVVLDGNTITDFLQTGLTQKLIRVNSFQTGDVSAKGLKVTYTTTGNCPHGVKLAILEAIAENYEKRGNTFEGGLAKMTDNFYNHLQLFKVY